MLPTTGACTHRPHSHASKVFALKAPKLRVAAYLLKKKLGFRGLLEVVPFDARLVKGSHGRLPDRAEEGPLLLCSNGRRARERLAATDVRGLILDLVFSR